MAEIVCLATENIIDRIDMVVSAAQLFTNNRDIL